MYSTFAGLVGADLSEVDRPLADFARFDDFFTRPIAPANRPVATAANAIVSPCDGMTSQVGVAAGDELIQCKGRNYSLAGLLGGTRDAQPFLNGTYATLYLAPRNYHRVHAPMDMNVTGYSHLPGAFYPVNPLSVGGVAGLFTINERLVVFGETARGKVAVVFVAATGVGHISLAIDPDVRTHNKSGGPREKSYDVPKALKAGDELGMFHLGSTVILVFEPKLAAELTVQPGDPLRVNMQIGRTG